MKKLIEWSKDLKEKVEASAKKSDRTVNAEIRVLLAKGLKSKR